MNKQGIIDEILPLLKLGTPQERTKMRAELESHTLTELQAYLSVVQDPGYQLEADETALAETKAARGREFALLQVFKFSGLANTKENESLLDRLLGPTLSLQTFRSLCENNPGIARKFKWESQPFARVIAQEQEQNQQRANDRRNFAAGAKAVTGQSRGDVSDCDANFNAVREKLGTQFSVANVVRVLTDGSIQGLAPSINAAELRQAHQQRQIEAHNESLLNADTATLRKITRQEVADQRQAQAQTEADRQLQLGLQRETAMGFSPLPNEWRGQKLDAHFIKTCNVETHKILTARFGSGQLTARLRGN